jgi:excisionase family DNA binding protein
MSNYLGDEATTLPFGRRALPELLRVEELAELLRVDRKTVYEAIAKGEIPGARRLGRHPGQSGRRASVASPRWRLAQTEVMP